jgi:hypothetical protein
MKDLTEKQFIKWMVIMIIVYVIASASLSIFTSGNTYYEINEYEWSHQHPEYELQRIDTIVYIIDDSIGANNIIFDTSYHAINIEHPFWDNDTLFESMTHINLEPEIQFTIGDSIFILEYGSYMIPIDSIMHHLILLKLKE